MLPGTNARPLEKMGKFIYQVPVDLVLRFEFVDILGPDFFVVVDGPHVKRDHGSLFHEYRVPAV